jgi:hypothetical protein
LAVIAEGQRLAELARLIIRDHTEPGRMCSFSDFWTKC